MNIVTANKLYELRKKSGLSQEELAEKLGVSRQAVSKWERAEASPDTDNLIALSNLYNISLDELIGKKEVNEDKVLDNVTKEEVKDSEETKAIDESQNNMGWLNLMLLFVAIIAMLLLGFIWHFWSWCWLAILLWLVISSLINAIEDKKATRFNYPVFAALIYLFLGLVTPGIWHPTWIIFVTIPMFYALIEAFEKRKK